MSKPVATMKMAVVSEFLDAFAPEDDVSIDKVRGTNVLMVHTATGEHMLRFEKKKPGSSEEPERKKS